MRVELNRGSLFEPSFETRRCAPRRNYARGGAGIPCPRLRRGGNARHRLGRRSLARQSVSLLPRQGGTAVLLPGAVARADAGDARGDAARSRAARRPAPPPRRFTRPVPARRGGRVGGASRGGRAAGAAARADRRQARPLRARHPCVDCRRHPPPTPARRRCDDRHPRLPRRAQLDRSVVPAGRTAAGAAGCRRGRRLRGRRTPAAAHCRPGLGPGRPSPT